LVGFFAAFGLERKQQAGTVFLLEELVKEECR